MSSMSGYITYIEYSYGAAKGATQPDDKDNMPMLSNPFGFGKVDETYTSNRVVEFFGDAVTTGKVAWGPVVVKHEDGNLAYKFLDEVGNIVEGGSLDENGNFTAPEGAVKIAYEYNNVVVPQSKIPSVTAKMKSIALTAKARRIAVYYSQIAA